MAGSVQALVTVHLERLGGCVFGPHREHWVCLHVGSSVQYGVTRGIAGISVVFRQHEASSSLWSPGHTRGLFLFLGSPLSLSERSLLWAESFPFCSHSQARGLAALTGSGMVRSSAFVFLGHPCAERTLPLTGDLGTLF